MKTVNLTITARWVEATKVPDKHFDARPAQRRPAKEQTYDHRYRAELVAIFGEEGAKRMMDGMLAD